MTLAAKEIVSLVAKLAPSDRLQLVETILATLDEPALEISAAWAKEATDRLAIYGRGKLGAVDNCEVFGDRDRQRRFATWLLLWKRFAKLAIIHSPRFPASGIDSNCSENFPFASRRACSASHSSRP